MKAIFAPLKWFLSPRDGFYYPLMGFYNLLIQKREEIYKLETDQNPLKMPQCPSLNDIEYMQYCAI